MKPQFAKCNESCSRELVTAYLDGELNSQRELEFEMHLLGCAFCAKELNAQKKLLCILDSALSEEREVKLPNNFAETIKTKAESSVSGLRRPNERQNAILVCAVLFLPLLIGFGTEIEKVLATSAKSVEQVFAVAALALQLFYDMAFGAIVILRSLSNQFVFSSIIFSVLVAVLFILSLFALSRLGLRFYRA